MEVNAAETETFIKLGFGRMMTTARRLGVLVSERPDLRNEDDEAACSVYQLVVHCLGVSRWWLGHVIVGSETTRDRDAEFLASGTVDELAALVDAFFDELPSLLAQVESAELSEAGTGRLPSGAGRAWPMTKSGIVLHVIEEIFQHAGHADISADLLSA